MTPSSLSPADIYYRLQAYVKPLREEPMKAQRDLDEIGNLMLEAIAEVRGSIDNLE